MDIKRRVIWRWWCFVYKYCHKHGKSLTNCPDDGHDRYCGDCDIERSLRYQAKRAYRLKRYAPPLGKEKDGHQTTT